MPGTNHELEAGFMDALSFSLRPAAADLLMHYRLRQLLNMRKEGPLPELTRRFDLTTQQWLKILDAVILSKISYFRITPDIKEEHLEILQKAAGFALHQPGMSLTEIYKRTEKNYTFFSQVILKMMEVKRIKAQLQKA